MCNYKTPKNLEAIRTIQLLEADIEENRDDIGFDNSLDTTLKTQSWKKKRTYKLDFIKIENFCSVKTLSRE